MNTLSRLMTTAALGTLLLMTLPTCDEGPVADGRLSEAYAEILIQRTIHRDDSVAGQRTADSIAAAHGFDDAEAVTRRVEALADEPDRLRVVLDSTSRLLEAASRDSSDQ